MPTAVRLGALLQVLETVFILKRGSDTFAVKVMRCFVYVYMFWHGGTAEEQLM
jgi:hypothetical protein